MKQWTTVDKSEWPRGQWDNEPDKVSWTDPVTGKACLVVRGPSGSLCGYVAVEEGHPSFEQEYSHYDEDEGYSEMDVTVHGGLTFSNKCQKSDDPSVHVCHVPEPGRPDNVWWFGFDCAHSGDITPANTTLPKHLTAEYGSYKTLGYVQNEVISLALQLTQLETPNAST